MKIYLLKKKRGRQYRSDDIIQFIGKEYGPYPFLLRHGEDGSPHLLKAGDPDGEGGEELFVSISDTKEHWAAVIADAPTGLDMEERTRRVRRASARALHPLEKRYLDGLPEESSEWNAEFLEIWTRKEAWMKLSPRAMREGMSSFSVLDETLAYRKTMEDDACIDRPARFVRAGSGAGPLMNLCTFSGEEAVCELIEYGGTQEQTALEKSAALLGERAYSARELERKLLDRGYARREALEAVSALSERGYLDDRQLADDLIRRAREAGKGRLRISRELSLKGIAPDIAASAMEEAGCGPEDELRRALSLCERLFGDGITDDKTKAKAARKLSALGYDAHTIWAVLDRRAD